MKIIVIDDYANALNNIGKALEVLGHNCTCILTRERIDDATTEADLHAIGKAIREFQPDLYFLDEGCHPMGRTIAYTFRLPKERVVSISSGKAQEYVFAQLGMKEQMNIPQFDTGMATHILGFLMKQEKHLLSIGLRPLEVRGSVRQIKMQ